MSLLYAVIYIAVLGILSHFVGQALPRARFSAEAFRTARRTGKTAAGYMKSSV